MTINYKLMNDPIKGTPEPVVKKIVDGAISFIPFDDGNTDYIEYKNWLAEGNTPESAD